MKMNNGQILDEVVKSVLDNPVSSDQEKTLARFLLADPLNQFAFLKMAALLMTLFPVMFLQMIEVVQSALTDTLRHFHGMGEN